MKYSLQKDGQTFLSAHFQIHEFSSYSDEIGLTTDDILIEPKLIDLLESIYAHLDCSSIIVTSGYRDYTFEMYLAGFCGYHNKGMAADIVCYDKQKNPISSKDVCCAAQSCGANGIGLIGPYSVHVDVREGHWWAIEDTMQDIEDWYVYAGKTAEINPQKGTGLIADVSFAQGWIDWERVKKSGVDGVIIRCGYGDDDPSQDDEYWTRNADECERLGIPYGVYLYTYADTWEHAKSEIAHIKRLLAGRKLQLPVYIDIEDPSILSTMSTDIFLWMGEQIEAMGFWCGMYASASVFRDRLGSDLDHFTRWVAQYNDTFDSYGDMWQYTDAGVVDGINTGVDLSLTFRDLLGEISGSQSATPSTTPSYNEQIKKQIIDLANKIK